MAVSRSPHKPVVTSLQDLIHRGWIHRAIAHIWKRLDCALMNSARSGNSATLPAVSANLVFTPLRPPRAALRMTRTVILGAFLSQIPLSMCDISVEVGVALGICPPPPSADGGARGGRRRSTGFPPWGEGPAALWCSTLKHLARPRRKQMIPQLRRDGRSQP